MQISNSTFANPAPLLSSAPSCISVWRLSWKLLKSMGHTVGGKKSGLHQLRFVVYPIIYRVLAPSQVVIAGFLPSTVSWISWWGESQSCATIPRQFTYVGGVFISHLLIPLSIPSFGRNGPAFFSRMHTTLKKLWTNTVVLFSSPREKTWTQTKVTRQQNSSIADASRQIWSYYQTKMAWEASCWLFGPVILMLTTKIHWTLAVFSTKCYIPVPK